MKYFRQEEELRARFPKNFISGFLEVCSILLCLVWMYVANHLQGRNWDPTEDAGICILVHSSQTIQPRLRKSARVTFQIRRAVDRSSRMLAVSLSGIKFIPSLRKLVPYNVTRVYQIVQAFCQCFIGCCASIIYSDCQRFATSRLFGILLVPCCWWYWVFLAEWLTYPMFVFGCSSLFRKDAEWCSHRTRHRDYFL